MGPVTKQDLVTVIEDTTTTGATLAAAVAVLTDHGIEVAQAVVLVDRSEGVATDRLDELGVPLVALITPQDLGLAR